MAVTRADKTTELASLEGAFKGHDVAILIVSQTGLTDRWTGIGAVVWLGARILYLPIYAAGIPRIRTLVFLISIVGIGMILWPALFHWL